MLVLFVFWAYGVVLKISITLSLENRKPTETDWNRNTSKPIDFQPFQSVSVENFTNRNIRFRLAIPIQTDRNRTEHTPSWVSHFSVQPKELILPFPHYSRPRNREREKRKKIKEIEKDGVSTSFSLFSASPKGKER